MLVERLRIRDPHRLASIWGRVLEQSHALHELFVLQLHPERFPNCAQALDALLRQARSLSPSVWLANLSEITAWWRSRRNLRLDALPAGEGVWEITAAGPKEAVILVRNAEVEGDSGHWHGAYRIVRQRQFRIRCDQRPSVSLGSSAPLNLVRFLSDVGYLLEVVEQPSQHDVHIDATSFDRADTRSLITQIESADSPLVRWARWPKGCSSALCVSGDIDSLTLWDYLLRPFEK
jgi:hypothetical protein